jgi:hypothetical protein
MAGDDEDDPGGITNIEGVGAVDFEALSIDINAPVEDVTAVVRFVGIGIAGLASTALAEEEEAPALLDAALGDGVVPALEGSI